MGYNRYGQLGDGTYSDRKVPTRIGTDTDWTVVAAGEYYSMALKSDGTLWTWGASAYLGDGSAQDRNFPQQINPAVETRTPIVINNGAVSTQTRPSI